MSFRAHRLLLTLAILPLLPLGGCTSTSDPQWEIERPADKIRDKLTTSIGEDGLKLFTYTVVSNTSPEQEPLRPIRQSRLQGQSTRGNGLMQADLTEWTEQIELGLARTLEMSGFCREGSVEISRLIQAQRAEIRGECNEGASQEDRRRFGQQG